MKALVLSGGAALGDFQVGAVRCLYDRGFTPDLIAASSVGSINGAKIAEGENRVPPSGSPPRPAPSGLAGLERIWLSLIQNSDMYVPNTALDFGKLTSDLGQVGFDALVNAVGAGLGFLGGGAVVPIVAVFDLTKGQSDVQKLQDAIQQVLSARSIYALDPIRARLARVAGFDPAWVASSSIRLMISAVSLETGALRFVDGNGAMTESDGRTPVMEATTLNPACQGAADAVDAAQAGVEAAREALSAATTPQAAKNAQIALQNAEVRLTTATAALAQCQRLHPPLPAQLTVDLVDAVVASASIPAVFPPVGLGHANYVDGGLRENVPIRAALSAGATDIVVVLTDSRGAIPPASDPISGQAISSFNSANLVDIAARAVKDIIPAVLEEADIEPIGGFGAANVTKIRPDVDIHGPMTIDPGLIRIRIAQGYMRADDVLAASAMNPPADPEALSASRGTTAITGLRRKIWEREFAANGWEFEINGSGDPTPPVPLAGGPDAQALTDVRGMKRQLKQLVDARTAAGGVMPGGPVPLTDWWLQWEAHQWSPVVALWDPTMPFDPPRSMVVTTVKETAGRSITLLVTDATTKGPIADALVTIGQGRPKSDVSGSTGPDGRVTLQYSACFTRDGEGKNIGTPCGGMVRATGYADGSFETVMPHP